FWQPSAVIIDTAFLKTLPKRHIQNGMLEAIQMHLVIGTERPGFQDPAHIRRSIRSSLSAKARIVQRDEKENGERMLLNFGHTIGHAIEKVSGYTVLHGIAVGYGILAEARIAHEIGLLSSDALERITLLLRSAGIAPATLRRWNARAIIAATKYDKKRYGGKPLYVLLRDIGSPYRKGAAWAHPVPDSVVYRSLAYILTSKV
ncbi:hypothetical protein HYV71_04615, partial [Candidatus Uhrbacteria bacterium]|nr:hypothetical protein [Candidatus Uhrbacteria bacterium]